MNLPTVIVLLVVLALVVVAVYILRMGKGKCACDGNAKKPENSSKCASCVADCPLKGL